MIGFLVPYHLGIYFAIVLALFGAYAAATGLHVRATLIRRWKLGAVLGLVVGVALVLNVFSADATAPPHGAYFVFVLIWRGAIYGAVDALLLTVLPCPVPTAPFAGALRRGAAGSPTSEPRSRSW